ncbi:response regulator [Virgibacillus sp. 179-BFC.A HS]|uniref:Response regulator n=1 Tax=Tigheibacillus jepli TaxID=3035914 RepID=A0ABU5CFI4_9BACI|nr:response regulator [Virgibacillus sp. 179-BFC.A HS]MDY0404756.1 response regulator [Virgibacillus sp. 179-BFC.A HS]
MTHVLIADDSEDIRFTLREICTFAHWHVSEAATGKEAVHVFQTVSPDIVLIDYHMPHWDGIRTTKEIRKLNQTVPIIILTVDERQEIADSFLDAGATDFSLKPIKAPDLLSRIRVNLKVGQLTKAEQSDVFVEKGINAATLRAIKSFLLQQSKPVSINDIKNNLPIAYQTVHRYLNYLETQGVVHVIPEYGKTGRPKNKYQLV